MPIAALLLAVAMPAPHASAEEKLDALLARITRVTGATPTQWRVTWRDDPAHKAIVSWTTAEPAKQNTVYYDTKPHEGKLSAYANKIDCHRSGMYTRLQKEIEGRKPVAPAYYHHAKLEALPAASRIYFVMVSDGEVSRELHFDTAHDASTDPAGDKPFSVLFGGDSRSGHEHRCRVNAMIAAMAERDEQIKALVHGGDYIVNGRYWGQWRLWLSHHELTTTASGRVLPIIPARGNHDPGPLFNEIFDFPKNDTNYYTTPLHPSVALITLNTNMSTSGAQAVWLNKQLDELRPKHRWLLAQYHRPLFPAVKSPGSGRKSWVPLFEKYNLDLACEADGHNIKRTLPIRGEKHDPTGVTYIGEGGMGVGQRKPDTSRWYLKPPGMAGMGHHMTRLDFSTTALRMRVILLDGRVADDHTLKPR